MTKQKVAGIVLIVAGLLPGCDHGERIGRLEKEVQELKSVGKSAQVSTDYDMQAKCSRDAKAWFNDNWNRDKDTILLDYSNHYNKAQNKCFELVEYHYSLAVGSSWVNDMTLWDVYENSKYGNVSVSHIIYFKSDTPPTETVGSCEVLNTKCSGLDEFNRLVQPFMNN